MPAPNFSRDQIFSIPAEPMTLNHPKIERIEQFFRRYEQQTKSLERLRIADFKSGFCRVSAGLQALQNLALEIEQVRASHFNIFSLLGVDRLEVATHSAILANLLNYKGTHGQGTLFLKKFLKIPGMIDSQNWVIEKEKVTYWGNLDVVLSEPSLKSCVIIENKVDAIDQPGQLARYYRWLKGSPYRIEQSRLIYLTIEGTQPTADSFEIDGITEKETKEIKAYLTRMSWRESISQWLRECLMEVQASSVREVLNQYLQIIQRL